MTRAAMLAALIVGIAMQPAAAEPSPRWQRRRGFPALWIYAQNDKFFGPELVRRMHTAFTAPAGAPN